MEEIKYSEHSWGSLNFKSRRTWWGFFSYFSSQTWENQFYDMWGYFTCAVQMLSSSSNASMLGRTTLWGTILLLPWLSVAVVLLVVSIVIMLFLENWTHCIVQENMPMVPDWICLSKSTNHSLVDGHISCWVYEINPAPSLPIIVFPIHFDCRLHFKGMVEMSIVGGSDNGKFCW